MPRNWVGSIAEQAGLEMSEARAEAVGEEVQRIRDGVARASADTFGFHDEPIHFLAALEACAEDGA